MAVVPRRDARAAVRTCCRAAALVAVVALLTGATTGCSPARRAERRSIAAASAADETRTLTAGGRQRTYLLHRPAGKSASDSAALPTVLVFHGGGGNPAQVEANTDFDAAADRAGFLAVYPAGYERSWNDLRTGDTKANLDHVDDVGFVSALIDELVAHEHADPAHVYAAGMSNGGMFSETLGCELGGTKIAAIAPVSGTMPAEVRPACAPARPIPVLEIHGTADPIVPFDGGHVAITSGSFTGGPAVVLSVDETQKTWRGLDHCTAAPIVSQLPDTQADGTRVSVATVSGCAGGTSVVLYTVTGGGHSWPGGSHVPLLPVGRQSRQISATDVITAFFVADLARK